MKALFLRTDFYGHLAVGGSFSHVKGFLGGLLKGGHSYAAVSSGTLPVHPGMPLYTIPYPSLYRNLPEVLSIAYNYKLRRAFPSILEKERPDFLYHRHSEFNFSSSVLARRLGIPLILEFNGSEVWVKKNWGTVYNERILRMAEQLQLSGADRIAVVSDVIRQWLLDEGIPSDKIVVNPNGVDPEVFHPSVDGSEIRRRYGLENKTVAGFVGTFGQWHGVEVLARSVRFVVKDNPSVHFLIVGDGKLRGEVERILEVDHVTSSVTLTGSVPHEEIPRYLAASDILLSPHVQNSDGSTFFGSPTKLFEYMAMGKAIIASPVGQISDIIQDGVNGLLMKHKDEEDLAEKILRLASDGHLRDSLGAAARNEALAKYSWEQNARRVTEAVQSVQAGRNA